MEMGKINCIKCKDCKDAYVILRQNTYCQSCFMENVTHKFRSSLGKNKLMKTCERVLLTLSGSSSSTVMLDMVYKAISLDSHKKLQMEPICLHCIGFDGVLSNTDDLFKTAKVIMTKCQQYNIPLYVVHPSVLDSKFELLPNQLPNLDDVTIENCNSILKKIVPTAKNDFISKLKRKMFINVAEKLNCTYIFTGEIDVTLAANMLSGIVVGRGDQLNSDVGFCDSRNKIKILRPMKDITLEEIKIYVSIQNIELVDVIRNNDNSLQSAIKSFVVDLQNSFQATVSTVCKTADKIGGQDENKLLQSRKLCSVCQSPVQREDSKLSALDATNFSRLISRNPQIFNNNKNIDCQEINDINIPSADDILCYGCSRTWSEFSDANLTENHLLFFK